ncbi:MAG: type II toxin-antitoxin system RelE/ParE family toxin [Rhizobiaceae bacterium]|nr:type II toxin-antitoxin system RelE/ParE family toxin [Rhizobiaceae bacterium]
MGFRLTHEAERDIIGLAEAGLRLFGQAQARQYHEELFDRFELIAANPRMARERHDVSPPVRIHPFKAHLIVYVVENGDNILVVRVRHGHEDWAGDPW